MNSNTISAFEYVTILISIILGLGITQLLSSVAEAFYHSARIQFYTPHLLWVGIVLFLHVQEWFVLYGMKSYTVWKLPTFLFIILYPILLFCISKLLFAPVTGKNKIDYRLFYLDNFPKIFYLFSVCIAYSVLFNIHFLQARIGQQLLLIPPCLLFFLLAYRKNRQEVIHYSLAIAAGVLVVLTTLFETRLWFVK